MERRGVYQGARRGSGGDGAIDFTGWSTIVGMYYGHALLPQYKRKHKTTSRQETNAILSINISFCNGSDCLLRLHNVTYHPFQQTSTAVEKSSSGQERYFTNPHEGKIL
jgi:hypothetical protein